MEKNPLKVKGGHVLALFMELVKKGSYFERCIRLVRAVTVSLYCTKCKSKKYGVDTFR